MGTGDPELDDLIQKRIISILDELTEEDPDSESKTLKEGIDYRTAFTEIASETSEYINSLNKSEMGDTSIDESRKTKINIISALLQNEKLTVGNIADNCGYADREDKYNYVSPYLRRLKDEDGYLCSEDGTSSGEHGGRPPTYYRIKPDIATIQTLYKDRVYQPLVSEFRRSPWLANLIIDTNFESDFHDYRELIAYMFRASRSFFECCLCSTVSVEELYYRMLDFDATYPCESFISEQPSSCSVHPPVDILLYHFFQCCAFADECRPDVETYPEESVYLSQEAQERITLYRDDYDTLQKTEYFMEGMQKLIDQCTFNENYECVVPHDIIKKIDEYETFLERYLESDPQDQHLKKDVDAICNEIMEMMDSPLRRREEEEDGS